MLSDRYKNDGKPIVDMSKLQLGMKEQVEQKISQGIYKFENVPCCICEGNDFEMLAEKDRHGLYMPVQICKKCGLIQTNPRMTQESYKEFYNVEYRRLYEDYNPKELFVEQYNNAKRIYTFVEKASGKKISGSFIFEVGCATGGTLRYFEEMGNEVSGIDISSEGPEFGRKTYGLKLLVGTLADVRFEKQPDLILYIDVFEHVLDPLSELKLLSTVAGQDTLIYLTVPGIKNLYRSYNLDFLLYLQNAHTYHFTLTTLENLIDKAGYKLVHGDENVQCIIKKTSDKRTEHTRTFTNDCDAVLSCLNEIEKEHSTLTLSLNSIKRLSRATVLRILKWLKLYRPLKSVYQKLKRRNYIR